MRSVKFMLLTFLLILSGLFLRIGFFSNILRLPSHAEMRGLDFHSIVESAIPVQVMRPRHQLWLVVLVQNSCVCLPMALRVLNVGSRFVMKTLVLVREAGLAIYPVLRGTALFVGVVTA